ncbi:hypothetical protein L3H44_11140 [Corynebacterium sp. MC-12]|uniref:Uncharacterized protein n=1 Tax=Corynebacterium parakroppenstedtii TaxID=2828363 RepID=A0ABS9HPA2_9CORY|nr:hypothetical protein [Corynebacterium parakroppenstedtii]MCF6774938.1 hypothetical protein [Corynebacterium parakroppenstedtii]
MPLAYVGFIKIINNWLWEDKKIFVNLEKEKQDMLINIEVTKERIKNATTGNELIILKQILQAREELLEILSQEIIINKSKQKLYVEIVKYYNIFG